MATTTTRTMTTTTPAIAYLRVSTQRQGQSGLGIEAQRQAVQQMAAARGLELVAEHVETESGRKADRPQLAAAMAEARHLRAVVVVAKLDRLARDAEFLLRLSREASENGMGGFLFCDLPDVDATTAAGRMVLTVMASVAEFEARRISERTRSALHARKAQGRPLGANLPHVQEANARRAAAAHQQAQQLAAIVLPMRAQGLSHQAIADRLTEAGVPTPGGKPRWLSMTVTRLLKRLGDDQASQTP
jgi:DNA invertase Pin-like site-specific DNA recombinase